MSWLGGIFFLCFDAAAAAATAHASIARLFGSSSNRLNLLDEQRLRLLRLDAIEEEKLRRRREKERQLTDSLDRAKHLKEFAGGGRSGEYKSLHVGRGRGGGRVTRNGACLFRNFVV